MVIELVLGVTLVMALAAIAWLALHHESPPSISVIDEILASSDNANEATPLSVSESWMDDPDEQVLQGDETTETGDEEERALAIPRPTDSADRAASSSLAANLNRLALNERRRQIAAEFQSRLNEIDAMEWGPEAEGALLDVLSEWSANDIAAALEYACLLESRRARDSAMNSILREWAARDPKSAIDWFMQTAMADPTLLSRSAGVVFRQVAAQDLNLAATRVWSLPHRGMKFEALQAVVDELVRADGEDALFRLHDRLSPGADRNMLNSVMIRSLGRYRPDEMADWALGLQNDGERSSAVRQVISSWGYDNPREAAKWVAQLPDDAIDRSRCIAQMTSVWAKEDPASAAHWLASMNPPAPALDQAIANLVRSVSSRDPAGAMAWAMSIVDQKRRDASVTRAAVEWMKTDHSAASQYILQSNLPQQLKDNLLSR